MSQPPPEQPQPEQPQPWGPQPQPEQPQPYPWDPQAAGPPAWAPPPAYGWAPQTRFDPNDPLISEDYPGWWRRSIAVIRRGWRPLVLLQLLFAVPLIALQAPAEIYSEREQRAVSVQTTDPAADLDVGSLLLPLLLVLVAALLASAVYAVAVLASIRMVAVIATGGRPTIGDALGAAVRRVPAMIGWYTVAAFICIGAVLACFLPLIYVGAVLSVLPAVVMFERGSAISRCFRLFHTDLGASVSRIATLGAVTVAGAVALGVVTLLIGVAAQGSAALDTTVPVSDASIIGVALATAVADGIYYIVAGVVAAPLIVTAYADMRARHEPFTAASLVG